MTPDKSVEEELKRMSHPAYITDLSFCDFLLLGYLKAKLIDK
jgi:hypothetical protein